MTGAVIVGVLACAALAFVVQPLRRGPRPDTPPTPLLLEEAAGRKRSALLAIVEMEQEAEVGKLSSEDLAVLRAQYEREALTALRELGELGTTGEDEDLEAEIAALRAGLTCPHCGAIREPGSACPRCGNS